MLNFKDIAKIFEEIELRLISSLKRNLARHKQEEQQYGFDWSAWQAEKLRNIDRFHQENAQIMSGYTNVIDSATRQIMLDEFSQGMNGVKVPETDEPHFFGVDDTKINKLIDDVVNLEKHAETAVLRTMDDIYRQTVNKAQLAMSTGSVTLQKAIDMSVKDFLDKGINCIVYRDGRRVNIADYVRMALRTTATRAALQGMSAKIRQLGYDTVLVSSYGMCSDTCLPWQGRPYIDDVFSMWDGEIQERSNGELWGKSHYCGKWFPLLSTAIHAGLFHPNCRHTMTMWRDGDPIPKPQDNSEIQRRYRLEQKQRRLENNVRKAKRFVEGQSDPDNLKEAKKRLREAQKELREFIANTNQNEGATILKRDYGREKIYTFSGNPPLMQNNSDNISHESVDNSENSDIINIRESATSDNVSEAENYARDVLGIPNVSYKGIDIVTANAWNEGLADAFSRFPELKKNFGFVGTCQERNRLLEIEVRKYYENIYSKNRGKISDDTLNSYIEWDVKQYMQRLSISTDTYAQSCTTTGVPDFMEFHGISVNTDYGVNHKMFNSSLKKNVEDKIHPVGCDTIKSVIDHEIGHQLDRLLGISDNLGIRISFDIMGKSDFINELSKYSWDDNRKYTEAIAEAWSEYCNNPNPRKVAQFVGDIIIKAYRQKFG